MSQSELGANTCSRRQARENTWEHVTICFDFTSDWLRKWREIFNQSQSVAMQNQSIDEMTFDTYWKTALCLTVTISVIMTRLFRIGKLMLLGAIFGCLDPVLTIGAILSYRSPFVSVIIKKYRLLARVFYQPVDPSGRSVSSFRSTK